MCDKEELEKLQLFIQQSNNTQTKEIKEHIDREITEIKKIIEEEKAKRDEIEKKYIELKEKYSVLEKSQRKNNLIIFGIRTNPENPLLENTLDVLNSHLKLNISKQDVNNIYTIGKQSQDKPIIIKLVSFLTKIEILKAAKNLKGTGIVISEELTLEERKRNKILRQHLLEARRKGLTANIRNNTLHINGETYTAEQLADNEENTDEESEENQQGKIHTNLNKQNNQSNIKKRPNNIITEEKKQDIQAEPKKRKIIASVSRASPRLNSKDENQKNKNSTPESSKK